MSRIAPPGQEILDRCEAALSQAQVSMGYLPNDVLSLCHWPELLQSSNSTPRLVVQVAALASIRHRTTSTETGSLNTQPLHPLDTTESAAQDRTLINCTRTMVATSPFLLRTDRA